MKETKRLRIFVNVKAGGLVPWKPCIFAQNVEAGVYVVANAAIEGLKKVGVPISCTWG